MNLLTFQFERQDQRYVSMCKSKIGDDPGLTHLEKPEGTLATTHPPPGRGHGRRPDQGAPGKYEDLAVLKTRTSVQNAT